MKSTLNKERDHHQDQKQTQLLKELKNLSCFILMNYSHLMNSKKSSEIGTGISHEFSHMTTNFKHTYV